MKKSTKFASGMILGLAILSQVSGCSMDTNAVLKDNLSSNLNTLNNVVRKMDTIDDNYLTNVDLMTINTSAQLSNISTPPQKYKVEYLNGEDVTLTPIEEDKKIGPKIKLNIDNNDNAISNETTQDIEESTIPNQTIKKERYIKSTYIPRYTTKYLSNNMDGYITKVQALYLVNSDLLDANDMCNNNRDELLSSINDLISMCEEIESNNWSPTEEQKQAIKNYIYDIKTSINRIRNSNGQITNEISNISSTNNATLSQSFDVLNSNYIRLLNHLDVRITYLQNAMTTLEQVRNILIDTLFTETQPDSTQDNMENNETIVATEDNTVKNSRDENKTNIESDESTKLEENNLTQNIGLDNNITTDSSSNTESETTQNENDNSNLQENKNATDSQNESIIDETVTAENIELNNDNTEDEESNQVDDSSITQTDTNENTTQNSDTKLDENITSNTINKEDTTQNDISGNFSLLENSSKNEQKNDVLQDNENNVNYNNKTNADANNTSINDNNMSDDNNINTQNEANNDKLENQEKTPTHNVDTYNNSVIKSNIDSMDRPITNNPNNNNISNTNNANNTDINNNGVAPNYNQCTNISNNTGITTPNATNNGNIYNEQNSLGYGIGQNHNDINTPNGTFQNGVIYQNNLNQGVNNGVNGTKTGYSGSGNYNGDRHNNNVNTYGFNTLVDMLNRGTVNNGINTLVID